MGIKFLKQKSELLPNGSKAKMKSAKALLPTPNHKDMVAKDGKSAT